MTVQELIAELTRLPRDAEVLIPEEESEYLGRLTVVRTAFVCRNEHGLRALTTPHEQHQFTAVILET